MFERNIKMASLIISLMLLISAGLRGMGVTNMQLIMIISTVPIMSIGAWYIIKYILNKIVANNKTLIKAKEQMEFLYKNKIDMLNTYKLESIDKFKAVVGNSPDIEHIGMTHICKCSLQIARNAGDENVKYFIKYFKVKCDYDTVLNLNELREHTTKFISECDHIKNDIYAIHAEVDNIKTKWIRNRVLEELHRVDNISDELVPYNTVEFRYTSATGRNCHTTIIRLDDSKILEIINYITAVCDKRNFAKQERSAMTDSLREYIHYNC